MEQTIQPKKMALRFLDVQLRAEEVEGKKFIRGYPILYNVPAQPWRNTEWTETIAPEALVDIDFSDCRFLVNHNPDLVLGRTGLNMRIEKDDLGAFAETEIHSGVQYQKDYYQLAKSGLIDGMSFAFMYDKSEIDYEKKTERITHITDIWEVSLVTFPAYPHTVAIAQERMVRYAPAPEHDEKPEERATAEQPVVVGPEPGPEERAVEEPSPDSAPDADVQKRAELWERLDKAIGGLKADA